MTIPFVNMLLTFRWCLTNNKRLGKLFDERSKANCRKRLKMMWPAVMPTLGSTNDKVDSMAQDRYSIKVLRNRDWFWWIHIYGTRHLYSIAKVRQIPSTQDGSIHRFRIVSASILTKQQWQNVCHDTKCTGEIYLVWLHSDSAHTGESVYSIGNCFLCKSRLLADVFFRESAMHEERHYHTQCSHSYSVQSDIHCWCSGSTSRRRNDRYSAIPYALTARIYWENEYVCACVWLCSSFF